MYALVLIPLAGWLTGLLISLHSNKLGEKTLIVSLVVAISAFFLTSTNNDHQWGAWAYLSAVGAISGVIGPMCFAGDKELGIGASVILGPCLVFGAMTLLFSAGCVWSGQCL